MIATRNGRDTTTRYSFAIKDHEGNNYDVVIYLNEKGKFIDDEISLYGRELEHEGTEGDIREKIIDYLDKNWDSLTK